MECRKLRSRTGPARGRCSCTARGRSARTRSRGQRPSTLPRGAPPRGAASAHRHPGGARPASTISGWSASGCGPPASNAPPRRRSGATLRHTWPPTCSSGKDLPMVQPCWPPDAQTTSIICAGRTSAGTRRRRPRHGRPTGGLPGRAVAAKRTGTSKRGRRRTDGRQRDATRRRGEPTARPGRTDGQPGRTPDSTNPERPGGREARHGSRTDNPAHARPATRPCRKKPGGPPSAAPQRQASGPPAPNRGEPTNAAGSRPTTSTATSAQRHRERARANPPARRTARGVAAGPRRKPSGPTLPRQPERGLKDHEASQKNAASRRRNFRDTKAATIGVWRRSRRHAKPTADSSKAGSSAAHRLTRRGRCRWWSEQQPS